MKGEHLVIVRNNRVQIEGREHLSWERFLTVTLVEKTACRFFAPAF